MDTDVYLQHIGGKCLDRKCRAYIEYRIIPEKCTLCGLCKDACKFVAVLGEKRTPYLSGYRPFEIRQKKCTKCDECRKVCPTGAVVVVDVNKEEPVGV
jgi:NAD-dependent dihydropyrimidine dehydrogenase PreA subunit